MRRSSVVLNMAKFPCLKEPAGQTKSRQGLAACSDFACNL
jgi:hypothetical protein